MAVNNFHNAFMHQLFPKIGSNFHRSFGGCASDCQARQFRPQRKPESDTQPYAQALMLQTIFIFPRWPDGRGSLSWIE
jgi:hypothetical protein